MIFYIGIGALAWGIIFDTLNVIVASHFWPVCTFTYIAASLLMYDGIKGKLPSIKLTFIFIAIILSVIISGMYIMSLINGMLML